MLARVADALLAGEPGLVPSTDPRVFPQDRPGSLLAGGDVWGPWLKGLKKGPVGPKAATGSPSSIVEAP